MNTEFDEIRPYHDEELPQVFEELIADPAFRQVVGAVMPGIPFEAIAQQMRACKTKFAFQKTFCYGILKKLIKETTCGVTLDRSELTDKSKAYTYISNHRDIILDSGLLSILLVDEGTSALDQKNADMVEESLLQNSDLTLILVSHHLSPQRKAQFTKVFDLTSQKV